MAQRRNIPKRDWKDLCAQLQALFSSAFEETDKQPGKFKFPIEFYLPEGMKKQTKNVQKGQGKGYRKK